MSSHLCFSLLLNIQRQIELQSNFKMKEGDFETLQSIARSELPNFPTRHHAANMTKQKVKRLLNKAPSGAFKSLNPQSRDWIWMWCEKDQKKQPSGINPELHGPMSYVSPASLRQKQNHESPASSGPFSTENKNRRDLVSLRGTSIHDSGVMWMFFP